MPARPAPASLQRRREQLLVRSARLRVRLQHEAGALRAPLGWADAGLQAARWLRTHPEWPLAALGLWAALGPRRAMRWATRGWWLWRAVRRLQSAALRAGVPQRPR
jgi:hypothetical protein